MRGAGVALALPWLESFAPRSVRAQITSAPKRLIVVYLPCGAPKEFWDPAAAGQGAAWDLSPILQPFAALKNRCTVLTGVENYSAYGTVPNDLGQAHGRRPGCFLTCANVVELQQEFNGQDVNGISADQVIAQHPSLSGVTALSSLQLSLGTSENGCDGPPCSYSRNISWRAPMDPALPEIDPGAAFDQIVGASNSPIATEEAQRRRALDQNILDYVQESAQALAPRLSTQDQGKVEEFLQTVRATEQRITDGGQAGLTCPPQDRPTLVAEFGIQRDVVGGYTKAAHSAIMNDLIVMALQCDTTRIVTHMLENERSEYTYDFLPMETFADPPAAAQTAGNYHGAAEGDANDLGTITRWNAGQVAALCQRLAELEDAPGTNVLDNTLVMLASSLSHFEDGANLPVILCGNLAGAFKTDQHVAFPVSPGRPLRDLYFTIMNGGFNLGETDFGNNENGVPISLITEILA